MRQCIFVDPRRTKTEASSRRALMLALGLAILAALAVGDARPATRHEGFSEPVQSLSFTPETVRLRTQP